MTTRLTTICSGVSGRAFGLDFVRARRSSCRTGAPGSDGSFVPARPGPGPRRWPAGRPASACASPPLRASAPASPPRETCCSGFFEAGSRQTQEFCSDWSCRRAAGISAASRGNRASGKRLQPPLKDSEKHIQH